MVIEYYGHVIIVNYKVVSTDSNLKKQVYKLLVWDWIDGPVGKVTCCISLMTYI